MKTIVLEQNVYEIDDSTYNLVWVLLKLKEYDKYFESSSVGMTMKLGLSKEERYKVLDGVFDILNGTTGEMMLDVANDGIQKSYETIRDTAVSKGNMALYFNKNGDVLKAIRLLLEGIELIIDFRNTFADLEKGKNVGGI